MLSLILYSDGDLQRQFVGRRDVVCQNMSVKYWRVGMIIHLDRCHSHLGLLVVFCVNH